MNKLYCCRVTSYNPYTESDIKEITESTFVIDGYHIADRLLEGVEFFVTFNDTKVTNVEVNPKHASYFSQFNEKMFMDKVKNYAAKRIEGDEVDIPEFLKKKYYIGNRDEWASYISDKDN
jgi:hypothetical protein